MYSLSSYASETMSETSARNMAARQLYTEKIFRAAILRKSNRVKALLHVQHDRAKSDRKKEEVFITVKEAFEVLGNCTHPRGKNRVWKVQELRSTGDLVHRRNMQLRGFAQVVLAYKLKYGEWVDSDFDMINLIDDEKVRTILLEAISKGGEMSKEELDMVKDWETEINNYLT
jgi:hypothetical protein